MRIDLEAFAGGILSEKVNKAMEKIAENIVDPNTDPKAKRKIKITLTFSGKEPSYQTCEIAVDTVLAGEKASMTGFGFGENLRTGEIDFREYGGGIPGQITFQDIEELLEEDEYQDRKPVNLREVK